MVDSLKKKYFDEIRQRKEEKDWIDEFVAGQGYCLACGHDYPLDMEGHHAGAKANSDLIISMCRNCHGRITRKQMKSWPDGWNLENKPKKMAILLRGLSDLLMLVGRHLRFISDEMLADTI